MDMEHTPALPTSPRARLKAAASAGALLLLLTGCGLVGNTPEEEADDTGDGGDTANSTEGAAAQEAVELPVGSTTTSTAWGPDLEVEIQALERVGSDALRLTVGVGNHTTDDIRHFKNLRDNDLGGYDLSGLTLLDVTTDRQYLPLTVGGDCVCEEFPDRRIRAGVVESTTVLFPAPPEGVETMAVLTPITAPFHGVPLTDADEEIPDPGADAPVILDLTHPTDTVVADYQRHETDGEVTYELAADVLFETDSAELGDAAAQSLERVAAEIDISSADRVSIDGHTDDTGDDSVNVPLSRERAEAVETALNDLVDRSGVTYDVDGHGSADPVTDNDTDEGRAQNRRVTVTFAK